MSSQKPKIDQATPAGEVTSEAVALPSSLLHKQEYFSFARPSSSEQMATLQQQLDWQSKLEQLQSQHKQESLQQKREHLEQLRMLQAQILSELTAKPQQQATPIHTGSITVQESPQTGTSVPPNSGQSLPTSPIPPIKRETAREGTIKGLSHSRSSSDPQLNAVTILSPTVHTSAMSSPIKISSVNHTPLSSPHTQSPSRSPHGQGTDNKSPQKNIKAATPQFTIGPSLGFLQPVSAPVYTSTALVRTSTTESLEQNSFEAAANSIETSPIKIDDEPAQQTKEVPPPNDWSPTNVPTVTLSSAEGEKSKAFSPARRKLAWSEASSWQKNPTVSSLSPPPPLPPSSVKNLHVKTSPGIQSLATHTQQYPAMQRLSPKYMSPHNATVQGSPGNTSVSMATPTALHVSRGVGSVNTSVNESQSRAVLMEKYHKHMEDLKNYYELELSHLRSRLEHLEETAAQRSELSSSSTPTRRRSISPSLVVTSQQSPQYTSTSRQTPQRQIYFPSSLVKNRARTPSGGAPGEINKSSRNISPTPAMAAVVNESELWMLQNENARLKGECTELQEQVDLSQREKHALEEQVKRLHDHTLDWKERLEASERMVSVLQERLEATRSQLYDQDKLVGQLQSDLQVDAEELQYWKQQRSQDMEKLEQLFGEFDVLQQENQDVRSANSRLQYELEEAHKKTIAYKVSVDKYQTLESQYKSTIRELEDEVRHLQHVNNRLHSMGTHYQLGSYGSPFNQPDEEKVQASPRPTTRTIHTPSTPQLPNATEKRETPSTSVTKVPLTRRKWLESSIPGLLFGGGSSEEGMASDQRMTKDTSAVKAPPPVATSSSRLPAMVNLASGQKESRRHSPGKKSPRKRQSSTSPSRSSDLSKKMSAEGEDPANYGYNQRWYEGSGEGERLHLADSALKAVREGGVIATDEGGYPNSENKKKNGSKTKQMSVEERVMKHIQIVSEAEQKLVALQKEKEKLESNLVRTPRAGTRTTRQNKQTKLDAEKRLEEVVKEIGSVRMVLRKHHALKK